MDTAIGFVAESLLELEGDCQTLRYYVEETAGEPPVYGIKVEKYRKDILVETEFTPPLYYDRAEAEALAKRFAEGSVTPMALIEMVDEWAYAS
ncbi:MAG: DUF6514 family protein [Clostridiales bacterium]|jgi:hypothetical protein|nr:DUF6514 family protein [Clostridiales bacterium]